ncbi:hypothetical protein D3C73_1581690 [compost metagenome]
MQQRQHLNQQRFPFNTTRGSVINQRHGAFAIPGNHRLNQRQRLIVVKRTEHGTHRLS